jgi:Fe-S-cluster containining protein
MADVAGMLGEEEQSASLEAITRVRESAAAHLGSHRDAAVEFVANLHRAVDKVMQQPGTLTACHAGCACCCQVRVEATEPEIFRIARELRQRPPAQIAILVERLRNRAAAADEASSLLHDCAFLEDRLCSIYEVRPAVCRRAHSLSAERCHSFAPEIPQDLDRLLRAEVLITGTSEAYRRVGLQSSAHELCGAVLLALTDATAGTRWLDGEAVFAKKRC